MHCSEMACTVNDKHKQHTIIMYAPILRHHFILIMLVIVSACLGGIISACILAALISYSYVLIM